MGAARKVIFNTIVLYAKILVSMAIALVSVPLVLRALGASDYGLYNLVAGVVAMLSFLNNSMTVSSQRYMSVAMGANNEQQINSVYNTSFLLHLILGLLVFLGLEIASLFIDKLNIEPDRIEVAQTIFQFLILTTFCRIVSVPFDAIMNAHEDMLAFSIIEVIDSILMLITAVSIQYFTGDKLIFYGLAMLSIAILTLFMKYGWSHVKYKKYRINLFKYKDQLQITSMFGFAGWTLFGGLAMMGRNQGVAIIINLFLGTIANAAYGVANQVNNTLSSFSVTLQKAINPQIMKSEGRNERERLLRISYISSKYSVLALALFAFPLIIEMPDVLKIWLGDDIPQYTMQLSRYILMMTIAYQYSVGIMSAIQAVGNIKNYQITMACIVLLNVPMAYFVIKAGVPFYFVALGFVVLEVISLIVRVFMAKKIANMPPPDFVKNVIKPTFIIIGISAMICLIPHYFLSGIWNRLIVTSFVYGVVFLFLTWEVSLERMQQEAITNRIRNWKHK